MEVLSGLQNLSEIAHNVLAHDEVDTYMSEVQSIVLSCQEKRNRSELSHMVERNEN